MLKREQLNYVMDFDRTIYTYANEMPNPSYELDFGHDNFVNAWMNETKSSEFLGKVMGNYVFRLQNVKETSGYIFYCTNNGKGLGVIDKKLNQSVLYRQMRDSQLQLTINKMKPVEDAENKWFGCTSPASYLKKIVDKSESLSTTEKEFVDKVKALEEDSNLVLLLYKSKWMV